MARTLSSKHAEALREKRKLNSDLCEKLGFHSVGEHLGIDYHDANGARWNTKVRKGGKDFAFVEAGKDPKLWNLQSLKGPIEPGEKLIITEGELDGAALVQAGFKRVVSVPNGSPSVQNESGDGRYRFLYKGKDNLIPEVRQFVERGKIVLATDNDRTGRWLRDELAIRLNDEVCSWVEWPEGCKDANDVLMKGGDEGDLRIAVESAHRMWNDDLGTIRDFTYREVETFTCGITNMHLRFELPCFFVMLGPYGCGKSTFLRQLLWKLWEIHGWRFLLTAFEEPVWPRIGNHFRSLKLNRMLSENTIPGIPSEDELARADAEIEKAGMFLVRPKSKALDLEHFFGRVELAVRRDGVKVIGLDPVNEMDHFIEGNEAHYWANFIMSCKQLADEYKLLFIASGHPPKDAYQKLGAGRLLRAVDMAGGANWGNKADVAAAFWKPKDDEDFTLMHLEKTKNHDTMGRPMLYQLRHIQMGKFEVADQGWNLWKRGGE